MTRKPKVRVFEIEDVLRMIVLRDRSVTEVTEVTEATEVWVLRAAPVDYLFDLICETVTTLHALFLSKIGSQIGKIRGLITVKSSHPATRV